MQIMHIRRVEKGERDNDTRCTWFTQYGLHPRESSHSLAFFNLQDYKHLLVLHTILMCVIETPLYRFLGMSLEPWAVFSHM